MASESALCRCLPVPELEIEIFRTQTRLGEIARNCADIRRDGHAVVIQNDDHGLAGGSGVIQPLKAETAAQCTVTDQSVKLSEPRRHTIDLRVAQQDEDVVAGKVVVRAVKHILVVIPKSDKGGSVAPAAPSNGSGEYAVRYWATYIDGKKVREVDQLNFICYVNGTDYLADVRKALGM